MNQLESEFPVGWYVGHVRGVGEFRQTLDKWDSCTSPPSSRVAIVLTGLGTGPALILGVGTLVQGLPAHYGRLGTR